MAVRYRSNPAGLRELLHDRRGPVVLHIANKGREAAAAARRRVGVKSGRTRASITSRLVRSGQGWNAEVSADTPYARFHHDGTPPHSIVPRGQVLVFEVGGVTVYSRAVDHPGTRPNRFLLDALRDVGLNPRRR